MADLLLRVSRNRGGNVESEEGEVVPEGIRRDAEGLGEVLEIGEPEKRGGELRRERNETVAER